MEPLLSIKELNIRFITEGDQTTAVKNSSFTINKGEIVALVGESGSGKSITALSVLRLLPGQAIISGEILFFQTENMRLIF